MIKRIWIEKFLNRRGTYTPGGTSASVEHVERFDLNLIETKNKKTNKKVHMER